MGKELTFLNSEKWTAQGRTPKGKLRLPSTGLKKIYEHNLRQKFVPNADPSMFVNDKEIIPLPVDADGNTLTYANVVKSKIKSIEQEITQNNEKRIRMDAILAISIVAGVRTSFTSQDETDFFIDQTKQWFEEQFNVAPDGSSNIVHMVYHADENQPHCHVLIIPIDEEGHLNGSRFVDNSLDLLHTSFAKTIGYNRGHKHSPISYKHLRVLKDGFSEYIALPQSEPGQSAEDYLMKFFAELEQRRAQAYKEVSDYWTNATNKVADLVLDSRAEMNDEFDSQTIRIRQEVGRLKETALAELEIQIPDPEIMHDAMIEFTLRKKRMDFLKNSHPALFNQYLELESKAAELYQQHIMDIDLLEPVKH